MGECGIDRGVSELDRDWNWSLGGMGRFFEPSDDKIHGQEQPD